jgi:hypothetical protein
LASYALDGSSTFRLVRLGSTVGSPANSRFSQVESRKDCIVGDNLGFQYSSGGFVSVLNDFFHEALPVCDVLAGTTPPAESLPECVPDAEPLAGTIQSVCASSKRIRLPRLLLHR